ncbi:unnamed protein product [Brassicogethes aeneus]|uniref:Uncharacterized protein n=1 Tax=Brassicogethes aeneus TaxID=1431903 RepID=A0A9P0BG67_BRAAE|nr:unnamed protein product [Brassicogethes aeneus]
MYSKVYILVPAVILLIILQGFCDNSYDNWKFHFPAGAGIGVTVAIPLDLPNKNAYLAYNFEANYALPDNATSLTYPPIIERGIDRAFVYNALETKMNTSGYPGKACLLRTICEASTHTVEHNNGVLGDILHIIFTPSTSKNFNLSTEYETAEIMGRTTSDCKDYNRNCTISFLDLISWIGRFITIKNPIQFPYHEPFQGIFLALALPLEIEEPDVFVAYNIEATYKLPENETEFSYPPLYGDTAVDRKFVYNILEYKLKSEYAFGDGITFTNPFRFPVGLIEGPFIGMFIAISVPLNLPEASLSLSYNMEANYVLPQNDSELSYPPIYERSFTRKTFYNLLEYKLKSHGYPGKQCLLRTICEASVYTMENTGVLGDIFHILLTKLNKNVVLMLMTGAPMGGKSLFATSCINYYPTFSRIIYVVRDTTCPHQYLYEIVRKLILHIGSLRLHFGKKVYIIIDKNMVYLEERFDYFLMAAQSKMLCVRLNISFDFDHTFLTCMRNRNPLEADDVFQQLVYASYPNIHQHIAWENNVLVSSDFSQHIDREIANMECALDYYTMKDNSHFENLPNWIYNQHAQKNKIISEIFEKRYNSVLDAIATNQPLDTIDTFYTSQWSYFVESNMHDFFVYELNKMTSRKILYVFNCKVEDGSYPIPSSTLHMELAENTNEAVEYFRSKRRNGFSLDINANRQIQFNKPVLTIEDVKQGFVKHIILTDQYILAFHKNVSPTAEENAQGTVKSVLKFLDDDDSFALVDEDEICIGIHYPEENPNSFLTEEKYTLFGRLKMSS